MLQVRFLAPFWSYISHLEHVCSPSSSSYDHLFKDVHKFQEKWRLIVKHIAGSRSGDGTQPHRPFIELRRQSKPRDQRDEKKRIASPF